MEDFQRVTDLATLALSMLCSGCLLSPLLLLCYKIYEYFSPGPYPQFESLLLLGEEMIDDGTTFFEY